MWTMELDICANPPSPRTMYPERSIVCSPAIFPPSWLSRLLEENSRQRVTSMAVWAGLKRVAKHKATRMPAQTRRGRMSMELHTSIVPSQAAQVPLEHRASIFCLPVRKPCSKKLNLFCAH